MVLLLGNNLLVFLGIDLQQTSRLRTMVFCKLHLQHIFGKCFSRLQFDSQFLEMLEIVSHRGQWVGVKWFLGASLSLVILNLDSTQLSKRTLCLSYLELVGYFFKGANSSLVIFNQTRILEYQHKTTSHRGLASSLKSPILSLFSLGRRYIFQILQPIVLAAPSSSHQ